MNRRIEAEGLQGAAEIARDSFGIPHIRASNSSDAWFAMGYACAEDRLFQMDFDRRRATGRWAEVAGATAVGGDTLAKRLDIATASRGDFALLSPTLRTAFESYCNGVNLAIATNDPPLEAEELGYRIEPWQPWHSIAAFKVRHVMMGRWQHKLTQAGLLQRIGSAAFSRLDPRAPSGAAVTTPPGGRLGVLLAQAQEDVDHAAAHLGFLAEVEPGSNAWAVAGSHTAHGGAVLCNDSHRALDVPNAYWQCHVTCPDFDVIGATFAGLPGFPHFGHNGHVAWAITHAGADTQDLYLEEFDPDRLGWYRTHDGWSEAHRTTETILVKDADPVPVDVWSTRHGQIVHGDPALGMAIALKFTATFAPTNGFEPLVGMLHATNVDELIESQRNWVDPVNNLVAADTEGRIAYKTRGLLPIRSSELHRRLPVPGWDDSCEWIGNVAFEDLPAVNDPAIGFIMTANNVITDHDEPFVTHSFADAFRAERLTELLMNADKPTTGDLAAMQSDTLSWAARAWSSKLASSEETADATPNGVAARRLLIAWDGDLTGDSAPALLYGCFRRRLAEILYGGVLGPQAWTWILSEQAPSGGVLVRRWLAHDLWGYLGAPQPAIEPPEGRPHQEIDDALSPALEAAWEDAVAMAGPDPTQWRWSDHHALVPRHPLSDAIAQPTEPGAVPMGGDGDTVQAASYGWIPRSPFNVTGLSVYRQVVDLADPTSATFAVPGGASGDPRSAHFSDQLDLWASHQRVPMLSEATDIELAAHVLVELVPTGDNGADRGAGSTEQLR